MTLLSLGVPMILMGDEVRRTQGGNNNAYCHDDESNWFDWTLVEKHADVLRFVRLLVARRVLRDETHERQRVSLTDMLRHARTAWHGVKLLQPDWSPQSHSLAFGAEMRREGLELHLIMNAYWEPLDFELPRRARSANRGGDGSIRHSSRPTTSSRGRRRRWSAIHAPITWGRARSWCCGGVSRTPGSTRACNGASTPMAGSDD